MRLRLAAAALLVVAGVLHFSVARSAWEEAARVSDEQRRLRSERRVLQQRVAAWEGARARIARAEVTLGSFVAPEGRAAPLLRRAILSVLAEAPVGNVRLAVRPGRGKVTAAATLSVVGPFDAVVRLSGELVRPGSGLALLRVRLAQSGELVSLDLDVQSVRAAP